MNKGALDRGLESFARHWTNFRGWRTQRRIIIFESDDWGAVRIPGHESQTALIRKGLINSDEPYHRFDCLESRQDLDALFNVLDKHRDKSGNAPIFTFNTVMGNPDFESIRANGYREFVHEPFQCSYERYHGEDVFRFWNSAIEESLIRAQFHAREHLNVGLWLRDLQEDRRDTRAAFDYRFYGLRTRTSSQHQSNYLAAYWPEDKEHLRAICGIVSDGLSMFKETFGHSSETFIACNFILPPAVEELTHRKGVQLIQGQRGQRRPSDDGSNVSIRRSYTGQKNSAGQIYSVRNVMFEPFEDDSRDWVTTTLREVAEAFFWHKPAIISTHRVNFVGGLDIKHRDRSLRMLERILTEIRREWPDSEFLSSDQLGRKMASQL